MIEDALAKTATAVISPPRTVPHPREYAHIVLKTAQPDALIDWYCKVLGMSVVLRTPVVNFLTWGDTQDRLAIMAVPPGKAIGAAQSNLHHVAFTYDSLAETVAVFRALAPEGIHPHWCVNHGVATSFYYRDPDGNGVELSVEHFHDIDELNAWLATRAFNENPIGVTLDAEELAARSESGEAEASILRPLSDHAKRFAAELARGQ